VEEVKKAHGNELIQKIKEARDRIDDERSKVKCTCSGFALQYEGHCGCGSERKLTEAKGRFWDLIYSIK